jgi:hypothetical protein
MPKHIGEKIMKKEVNAKRRIALLAFFISALFSGSLFAQTPKGTYTQQPTFSCEPDLDESSGHYDASEGHQSQRGGRKATG